MFVTNNQIITLEDVLAAKEQLAEVQAELRSLHGATVISITINMPGQIKYTADTVDLLYYAVNEMRQRVLAAQLTLCEERVLHLLTGPVAVLAVQGNAAEIKEVGMRVEQMTKFGRLLDIDVFNSEGRQMSRSTSGTSARSCFVCSGLAVECMWEQRHSQQEVLAAAQDMILEFKAAQTEHWPASVLLIGNAALEAILMEAACTPAPGLVDRVNSGAHRDMDFFTFIQSSSAINFALYRCAFAGWRHNRPLAELLPVLRRIGSDAERAMMKATGGVNTQKGLLFLMGIVAAATAFTLRRQPRTFYSEAVLTAAADICQGIVARELACLKHKKSGRKLTAGERLYLTHGITGIRGEIENGLSVVLQTGLPLLREGLAAGLSINDALVHALMGLMTSAEDTTILNRHDPETLADVQATARSIMADGGMKTATGRERIQKLDAVYSNHKNISPGGSADLLAVTYFLHKIEAEVGMSSASAKRDFAEKEIIDRV